MRVEKSYVYNAADANAPQIEPYAFIYKYESAESTVLIRNDPTKILSTTVAKRLVRFTTDSLNAVTYSGPSFYARVLYTDTGYRSSGSDSPQMLTTIAKNDTPINVGNGQRATGSVYVNHIAKTSDLLIENGDEITAFVENTTWTDNFGTLNTSLEVLFQRWAT